MEADPPTCSTNPLTFDQRRKRTHDADWGNGDGVLVYPGAGGPWPSLRLKALRRGLQDRALLGAAGRLRRARRRRARDACARAARARRGQGRGRVAARRGAVGSGAQPALRRVARALRRRRVPDEDRTPRSPRAARLGRRRGGRRPARGASSSASGAARAAAGCARSASRCVCARARRRRRRAQAAQLRLARRLPRHRERARSGDHAAHQRQRCVTTSRRVVFSNSRLTSIIKRARARDPALMDRDPQPRRREHATRTSTSSVWRNYFVDCRAPSTIRRARPTSPIDLPRQRSRRRSHTTTLRPRPARHAEAEQPARASRRREAALRLAETHRRGARRAGQDAAPTSPSSSWRWARRARRARGSCS